MDRTGRMIMTASLLAAALLGPGAGAQERSAPAAPGDPAALVAPYAPVIERIIDAALTEGQAYPILESLVKAAPHRLSGSSGADDAVAWAVAKMEELGFENVRTEPVTVPRWERGDVERLRVIAPVDEAVDLPVLALGGSVATPEGGLRGELVEVHSLDELLRWGDELRGKIVFFNRPMDPRAIATFDAYGGAVDQRVWGAARAAPHGAVATIVRSMTTRLDDFPHTGAMRYEDGKPRIPSMAVSTNGAEHLSGLLRRGPVTVEMELASRWHDDVESANVVGELVGRERPDEIVLVGGHLDCWDVGQGAHDDGSGCSQSLEVIRLLRSLDLRPRRTIRCVLFMNEENGLAGARTYRSDHDAEMPRHVFALESDRGGFTPRGFTTNANPEALATLRAIGAGLETIGAERVVRGSGGADVNPMMDAGVIVAGFLPDSQRYFDVHHSWNDTLDRVSARELQLGAAAMAALLYVVADMETTLPRNPVPPSR